MAPSEAYYEAVERRIEWLTLALGALLASVAGWKWGWRAGVGLAFGVVLSWLNFRWLEKGVGALLQSAAAGSQAQVHGSAGFMRDSSRGWRCWSVRSMLF
jgi:hypothetical protein